jgi:hypothetical protein
VSNFHPLEDLEQASFTSRTTFARLDGSQVEPFIDLNVSANIDAPKMVIVFVRARGHVATVLQRVIGDDAQINLCGSGCCFRAYATETASTCSEQVAYFFWLRRPHCGSTQAIRQFNLMQLVVATQ